MEKRIELWGTIFDMTSISYAKITMLSNFIEVVLEKKIIIATRKSDMTFVPCPGTKICSPVERSTLNQLLFF